MAGLGLVVVTVPAWFGIGAVTFNDSFKAVFVNDVPAIEAEQTIRRSVEVRQQPAFVPVESLAHAERVVATIDQRRKSRPEGELIDRVVSLNQFIPERQTEKIDVLRRLQETLADVPGGAVEDDEKLREVRAELDFLLDHAPVGRSDLPDQIRRRFATADGTGEASIVAVFPTRPLYRATTAATYIDLLSELPDADGGTTLAAVAYERMMSDFDGYIEKGAYRILALLIAGLLVLSFVAAPDVYEWVGSVVTLALALFVAAGFCGLLGIEFNVLNVVVWPIWIGVGLDALFHLNRHPPPVDPTERRQLSDFVATVGATAAAFATTMLGFGALAFSGHPGLASFGRAALVGFAAILLVSLLARVIVPRRV